MSHRATALTAAAGEYFAAHRLSALGHPVALTRGASPTADLMIGDAEGNLAVSLLVKTSDWARREGKRSETGGHWEWDVGKKAIENRGESIFYVFIDLCWDPPRVGPTEALIVPSNSIDEHLKPDLAGKYIFWFFPHDRERYLDRWDLIANRLEGKSRVRAVR